MGNNHSHCIELSQFSIKFDFIIIIIIIFFCFVAIMHLFYFLVNTVCAFLLCAAILYYIHMYNMLSFSSSSTFIIIIMYLYIYIASIGQCKRQWRNLKKDWLIHFTQIVCIYIYVYNAVNVNYS